LAYLGHEGRIQIRLPRDNIRLVMVNSGSNNNNSNNTNDECMCDDVIMEAGILSVVVDNYSNDTISNHNNEECGGIGIDTV